MAGNMTKPGLQALLVTNNSTMQPKPLSIHSFIYSFISSVSKYLLNTFSVLCTVLNSREIVCVLRKLRFQQENRQETQRVTLTRWHWASLPVVSL